VEIGACSKKHLTGMACTDEIAKWNSGTKRNVEPRPLSHIQFKKTKTGRGYT
jgi:hypothetical protein